MATPTIAGALTGKKGVDVRLTFRLLNGTTPVTGKSDGDFGKVLALDDALASETVSVNELDSVNLPGFYSAIFTPGSTGHYTLVVTETAYLAGGISWEIDVSEQAMDDLAAHVFLCAGGATYDPVADELHVTAFALKDGRIQVAPTSTTVKVYADSASPLFTLTSSSPDANGAFRLVKSSPGLTAGKTHSLEIEIVLPDVSPNPKSIVPLLVQQVA